MFVFLTILSLCILCMYMYMYVAIPTGQMVCACINSVNWDFESKIIAWVMHSCMWEWTRVCMPLSNRMMGGINLL